ncbi:Rid family hydrolase [Streptomyces sp. NBC_00400]|uniref:Rid family hydrolase n=1 Tax=Streptomyces sp. NBC_00400 TaxID=2975737 RepID=UPI002E1AF6A0
MPLGHRQHRLSSTAANEEAVRTRIMLTDVSQWKDASRAHGERFASVRPACTVVEVSRFIDPHWLVEVEVDAVTGSGPS